jgi:hypothetical protein
MILIFLRVDSFINFKNQPQVSFKTLPDHCIWVAPVKDLEGFVKLGFSKMPDCVWFEHLREALPGQKVWGRVAGADDPLWRTPHRLAEKEKEEGQYAVRMGLPPEAFSEDALFWAYVLKKRGDYQELLKAREEYRKAVDNAGGEAQIDNSITSSAVYLLIPSSLRPH